MSTVSLDEKIPNNVELSSDKRLQRALEQWQPRFIEWWREMGPDGFQANDVYLRTAVGVDSAGWAHFDMVKMPDYRWGIFLADPEPGRTIGFGDHMGKPVWQEIPGEYRNPLRRLIVTCFR
jgi:benzoyl-CoA 2,3-dioxygenase component B